MKQTGNPSTSIFVALILFVILFTLFMYTFLHEAGHAIAGLFFSQSLTEFDVNFWDFKAHVDMVGGNLSQFQLAVQSAAGAILPLLIWVMFIRLAPRKASFLLESLKLISSMTVVNTLLAWIILPVLFLLGKAPSDDVTNFLRYSGMPPVLLLFIAIILYGGGWILFLSKIEGLRNEFRLFGAVDRAWLITGTKTTLATMTGAMALCAILAFTLNISAAKNSLSKFSPPQDFEPVAQIDLSTRTYSAEPLIEFSLDSSTYVGVFVVVHDISTSYVDLSVTGPDGFHSIVLHGEGYNAFQDGGLWEKNLQPGTYQLVLTSHQSPGQASVYINTHSFFK